MILARKFALSKDDDYEHLVAASGRLRALLEAFSENRLPEEYGEKQLGIYARSLLATRRLDGSFAAYEKPDELDADVRTDVHRFVTWAALAFLHLYRTRFPHAVMSEDATELDQAIRAGLNSPVIADFRFPESGDAEPVQQVEAVLVLDSGGIPGLLAADRNIAPVLSSAIDKLADQFRERIAAGRTQLPGNIEYLPFFEMALSALGFG